MDLVIIHCDCQHQHCLNHPEVGSTQAQIDRQLDRESVCGLLSYKDMVHTWVVGIWYRYGAELSMVEMNILWMIGTSLKVENAWYCVENYQGYNPYHQHQNWSNWSFQKIVLL